MSKLHESINKIFEDTEVRDLISTEIERLSEEKAKEKASKYIDVLEAEANSYLDKKVSRIVEKVSEIVEETVKTFTEKYKDSFDLYKSNLKAHAILEALTDVCTIAGVNAELITREVNKVTTKNERVLESKVENLKRLITEEQDNVKNIKLEKDDEIQRLKESLNERDEEITRLNSVINDSELQNIKLNDKNKELKDIVDANETELQRLNDKIREKELENDEITEEKNNIAKLGVIAELKQNLSLSEAREFEKNAVNIPFSMDKSYIDKLTVLKDSIVEKQLNEVTSVPEECEKKWYDKYI